jgi:hypothetical protein
MVLPVLSSGSLVSDPHAVTRSGLAGRDRRRFHADLLRENRPVVLDTPEHAETTFKIASSRIELFEAFHLVYNAYLKAGLAPPNRFRMRVTPYHLLPTTHVFVAKEAGKVACTVSLVRDGRLGLPMEAIYGEEVASRRALGFQLAEVSCLADAREELSQSLPMVIELMTLMAQVARNCGVDELLIAVHPRHARFYRRFMAFEPIGDERTYEAVCGKPAIALAMNFQRAMIECPETYGKYFGVPLPTASLEYKPVSPGLREAFRLVVGACYPTEKVRKAERAAA